jgi:uncharacterized membrane protein
MSEDDERGGTVFSMGRTLSLSDGIFAIAMTLLAFQVQPPDLQGDQQRHLAQALADLSNRYWIYALSFAVIGIFWMGHHRLFSYFEAIDDSTTLLNLLVLMAMAALPFPSAVMGRYGHQRAAVILYAASMAVAGTLMTSLWVVADRRHLLSDRATKADVHAGLWRGGSTAVVFALSIPVAVVAPRVAPYVWIIVLVLRVAPAIRRRRATPAVT